ncbi:MAG: type II toxin-antitoxin system RelE/ParE family toxin [Deltaproteobacteria bacterium]|nr:type II toxin-antitoxin system RelE/ParE family toxin [Candidatus Desulfobacula maris]
MKIRIHELAAKEFDDAIMWYDQQSEGLGKRFKKTVKDSIEWYLKESVDLYKTYIPKFPYKVLFTVEKHEIIIWAIAHMHRKPWYWQSRIS